MVSCKIAVVVSFLSPLWPFTMDLLKWNLNECCTCIPDLQALLQYDNPTIFSFQKTHLCPTHTLILHCFTVYFYTSPDGDMTNGGAATLVKNCVYCAAGGLQTPPQASAVPVNLPHVPFTPYTMPVPPAVPVAHSNLTYLLSQDLNVKNIARFRPY
jgi:hypothetical protein